MQLEAAPVQNAIVFVGAGDAGMFAQQIEVAARERHDPAVGIVRGEPIGEARHARDNITDCAQSSNGS